MKTKKILGLLLSVCLLPLSLLACGQPSSETSAAKSNAGASTAPAGTTLETSAAETQGGNQPGGEKTNIVFYGGWTGADLNKMQELVDTFNKSQDNIQVEFTSLQWTKMFSKFLADYQAGAAPDVLALHTFEIGQFADMGVLDADAVQRLGLKEADFVKTAWDGCHYEGKLYGLPFDVNMHAIYVNKDMLKAAGITELPKTKEEFLLAAQKTTLDQNGRSADDPAFDAKNISQYGFGFAMNHHAFYQLYALLNQGGYNPFTADMKTIQLDGAKFAPAIQWLEDLIFKYKVVPVGEKSAMDDFKAGRVAMAVDGNWQLSGLAESKFDWDTMVYPQIFAEKAVWGAAELLTFPKVKQADAKKQAAAERFVKWLSENSATWAESGQIPARISAKESSTKLKGIQAYLDEMDYVKVLPAHPKALKIFSSAAPSPILSLAQDMVLNNKAADEIVPQFEKDINAVLSQP